MTLCFYINITSFLNSYVCGISGLYKDLSTALEMTMWVVTLFFGELSYIRNIDFLVWKTIFLLLRWFPSLSFRPEEAFASGVEKSFLELCVCWTSGFNFVIYFIFYKLRL